MKNVLVLFAFSLVILSGCCGAGKSECTTTCCAEDKSDLVVVMNLTRKVNPESVAGFKASFEKCKVETDKEPGCLDYAMYQSYKDSTEFIIVETWQNKGEHMKHMDTPHLKVHLEEIKGMGDPSFKATNTEIYVCPKVN